MFFSAKLFKQSPKSQLGLKITSQISSQVELLVSWSTSLDCQSMFSVFNSRKSFFVSKKIVHCKNFEQNNRQKVINLRRRLSRSLACVPCSDYDGDALFSLRNGFLRRSEPSEILLRLLSRVRRARARGRLAAAWVPWASPGCARCAKMS